MVKKSGEPAKATKTKKTTPVAANSAFVNSSFTVFYVVATVAWAKGFSGYFPILLQRQAFVLMVLFALMLYVFRYLLLQYQNTTSLLNMIVLYFALSAGMTLTSAVRGPLADGSLPGLNLSFFGYHVASGASVPILVTASAYSLYGLVTLACAAITAAIFEFCYNVAGRLLPKTLRGWLASIDSQIDTMSANQSLRLFYLHEWQGVLATVLLLTVYAAVFVVIAAAN